MTTTNSMGGSGMGSSNLGSDVRVPSGYEVESATFHVPVSTGSCGTTMGKPSLRSRIDGLKSLGALKVHELQDQLADRKTSMMTSLNTRTTSMREGLQRQMTSTQNSMKASPMKWAGIAAGSGFALGLIGRYMHWRNYHRRGMTPDLVIIDASC